MTRNDVSDVARAAGSDVLQEARTRMWLDEWEQRYLWRLIMTERGGHFRRAWDAVEERFRE